MPTKTVKENVTITYSNGVITITGKTFSLEGVVPSSELMSVYWGSKGKGTAKLSVKIDEPVPVKKPEVKVLRDYINDLADQGLTEDEIFASKISMPETD
jgi:hypothetical protein